MDVSKMNANGWKAQIDLPEGIRATIEWFVSQNK
jgi:nucleoside-diphosphate-sugar epimerase